MEERTQKILEDDKVLFIIKRIEEHMGLSFEAFNVKSRELKIILPRQMCIYFLYTFTNFGQEKIGKLFKIDHSTVHHTIRKINNDVDVRKDVASIVNSIVGNILDYEDNQKKYLNEEKANKQHQIWSHWMRYMFTQCDFGLPSVLSSMENGSCIIPKEKVDRWIKQMNTDYKDLTDEEKESDRNIVKKFKL
jgi:hypothetical protein